MDSSDNSIFEIGNKSSYRASTEDSGISSSNESLISSRSVSKKNLIGSRKRKSSSPRRSLLPDDPNFRGVTITMQNMFIDSEWKLVMKSKFSLSPRKKRKFRSYVDSSDDDDINNNNYSTISEEKHCASCSVKKTPLWRDAEDGTPLCNACGIRYKKYKLRCGTCWHIPKKDEFHPTCQYCGSFYEYVYPRR
ncbi:GATA-type zinc finger protein 1 [Nephila pilipes]|uniref:GATA-type zinc finger protein 1 n=1 Tax=Nephila pilipes TaxID=299642 RepID=A0A8X6UGE7_NEPPI|nr:GATA-type zinc finger protein 1 [Nephila pilipes]